MSGAWLTRAAALALAAPLAACGPFAADGGLLEENRKEPTPAAFLGSLAMTMPPATVEFYDHVGWIDDNAKLVLVMAEADWAAMRDAPPLKDVSPGRWSSDDALRLPANDGKWRPRDDRGIVATQVRLPRAQVLTIGHSPAAPGRVRVYLFWHET